MRLLPRPLFAGRGLGEGLLANPNIVARVPLTRSASRFDTLPASGDREVKPHSTFMRRDAGILHHLRQLVVVGLHQAGEFVQRHRLARDVGDGKLALNVGIFAAPC